MTQDHSFRKIVYASSGAVAMLWVVKAIELLFRIDFRSLGIYPRTLKGSIGIIGAPFVHSDYYHLISNSLPLFFLLLTLFYFYRSIALKLIGIFYLGTGSLVWLIGREANHVGASGVIYALMGFVLLSGFLRKSPQPMAIAFIFLFLYGGVLQGVFPQAVASNISWESHLAGFVLGGICAFLYRNQSGPDKDNESEVSENEVANFTGKSDFYYTYKKD